VALLPSASSVGAGGLSSVTDALTVQRGAVAVGGGSNKAIVYSDGTDWFVFGSAAPHLLLPDGPAILSSETGNPEILKVVSVASALNEFTMTNNAAGSSSAGPDLAVTGDDTNISLGLTTKGTGRVNVNANNVRQTATLAGNIGYTANNLDAAGNARFQAAAANFASYIIMQATASTTISEFTASHGLKFQAGDAAVGDILFYPTVSGGQYKLALTLTSVASGVNSIKITPAATGAGPIVEAIGTDTDVDLNLTPKGAGVVKMGTHSALSGETVTGYITIKDAAGNVRKLAVVS
jgi:hypothetical protein